MITKCKNGKEHKIIILEAGEHRIESTGYCTSLERRVEFFGQTYRQVALCTVCLWHHDPITRK